MGGKIGAPDTVVGGGVVDEDIDDSLENCCNNGCG